MIRSIIETYYKHYSDEKVGDEKIKFIKEAATEPTKNPENTDPTQETTSAADETDPNEE